MRTAIAAFGLVAVATIAACKTSITPIDTVTGTVKAEIAIAEARKWAGNYSFGACTENAPKECWKCEVVVDRDADAIVTVTTSEGVTKMNGYARGYKGALRIVFMSYAGGLDVSDIGFQPLNLATQRHSKGEHLGKIERDGTKGTFCFRPDKLEGPTPTTCGGSYSALVR